MSYSYPKLIIERNNMTDGPTTNDANYQIRVGTNKATQCYNCISADDTHSDDLYCNEWNRTVACHETCNRFDTVVLTRMF